MDDMHEMRKINGRIRAVYTTADGDEYYLVDGEMVYLATTDEYEDGDLDPEQDEEGGETPS